MIDPKGLMQALEGGKRLVVFLHDNPDPDAVAAGWLLEQIGRSLGLEGLMVHGGAINRAENSAMVRLLGVPLTPLDRQPLKPTPGDRYALVDTQPGTGNNAFSQDLRAHVVIDHHPRRASLDAGFVDVRDGEGCTTTLLLRYHQAFGLDLSPSLATAAFYAILSETQDLEREASKADLDAYQRLFPLVQLNTLGKIRHPPRDREYYETFAHALQRVLLGKNTCVCHIGPVPAPEVAAEVADFLVAMKRITWCLASGHHEGHAVLSIRTTHEDARADQVMRKIVARRGRGGGHGMMAGGSAPCADAEAYARLTAELTKRFLEELQRGGPEQLRPLLEDGGAPPARPRADDNA